MGLPMTVKSSDIAEVVRENVQSITKQVAEKIIELNGDKSVSAVFVVGGGGKITGFTECLAAVSYTHLPIHVYQSGQGRELILRGSFWVPSATIK